jgi:hypothetical protein
VEVDGTFGGLGRKIRGFVIYAQTHMWAEKLRASSSARKLILHLRQKFDQ